MSREIHSSMTFSVLHSRFCEFVERMSFGSIINRFSMDIDKIDRYLPQSTDDMYFNTIKVLFGVYVFFTGTNSYIIIFLCFIYLGVGLFYR